MIGGSSRKPHLVRRNGFWLCTSAFGAAIGKGLTPYDAWISMFQKMRISMFQKMMGST